jgi:UDP-N-acetylglucosamine 2-epimerase (non-hydrolysing)
MNQLLSARARRVDIIAGARPNFMKVASIIRALRARAAAGGTLAFRLVHTGQHYDQRMSGDFFAQLEIPEPDVNLEVGSGSHAEQTAAIMVGYERLLVADRSDLAWLSATSPRRWHARSRRRSSVFQ